MTKAVIFDLDGTIGDTVPLCIAAFKQSIEPLADRTFSAEEIIATFGPSEEGTIQTLIPDSYEEGMERFLKYYQEGHGMCPEPFPGIKETITWLKSQGTIIAMVTGKGRHSCALTLTHYGMENLFDMIETGHAEGPRKTEGIRAVLAHFQLQPHEAVYVGDAPTDIRYSREAGVPVISAAWAKDTHAEQLRSLRPDELFTSVEDFSTYLKTHLAHSPSPS